MMLRRINIVFGLLIVLLFFQCDPIEIVPDIEGQPVFFIHAETGTGDSLHFVAGLNHYELVTSYEQIDGVYTFTGEFKKEADQTDSLASLRFEITDVGANIPIDIENALMQPSYNFLNENQAFIFDTTYVATFMAEPLNCPQLPPNAYTWENQDSILGIGSVLTKIFTNGDDRIIKLTLDYESELQTTTEQNFSFTNMNAPCGLGIQAEVQQGGAFLELITMPTGTPPFVYLWQTGDTSPALSMPIDTFVNYSVSITDANGCMATAGGDVPMNIVDSMPLCTSGFTYTTDMQVEIDTIVSLRYSIITIIYTDINGQKYRSDFENQDTNSFFNIQMVDDFPNNGNGEKTKKLNIDFEVELFSPTEGIISLQSTAGVLGIAYPE